MRVHAALLARLNVLKRTANSEPSLDSEYLLRDIYVVVYSRAFVQATLIFVGQGLDRNAERIQIYCVVCARSMSAARILRALEAISQQHVDS